MKKIVLASLVLISACKFSSTEPKKSSDSTIVKDSVKIDTLIDATRTPDTMILKQLKNK